MQTDHSTELQAAVRAAITDKTPLRIVGGNSKRFYGRMTAGTPCAVAEHRGIVHYEPGELILTARAGTPLAEIEATLAAHNQMLPFEPPHFGPTATLGGTIACGIAGPRRPYTGAVRDFVLGVKLINGRGELVRFGGEVMKNVAGFDVQRLMVGALGTLGLLLEISLKVLPRPQHEITLSFTCTARQALTRITEWSAQPMPISGTCHDGTRLYARLSGSTSGVTACQRKIGGDILPDDKQFWYKLREHQHEFFKDDGLLWRLSVPPAAPLLNLPGQSFLDWGGALRWLKNPLPADVIRASATKLGGHATLFRGGERTGSVFHPLPPALLALHKRIKNSFDPHGIFNPGQLYSEF
ncbi:MAG: glycolate oxidase subunit GlcE [Gammaproteobacteria bacterium]|nr:glycolate oxidase subunit GlcE [Gammaproteobacteria bacterium]